MESNQVETREHLKTTGMRQEAEAISIKLASDVIGQMKRALAGRLPNGYTFDKITSLNDVPEALYFRSIMLDSFRTEVRRFLNEFENQEI